MDSPSAVSAWHPGVVLPPEKLTPDIITAIQAALTPAQTVGLTCWAEARSRFIPGQGWRPNPIDAMADVANVIDNRALDRRWRARGHKGVCLQRWAFSCWEPTAGADDPADPDHLAENFEALITLAQEVCAGLSGPPLLQTCIDVAQSFIEGRHPNLLGLNVCHYIADWLQPWPTWALGHTPTVARHGHLFFTGIK